MTRYADPQRCPDCQGPMPYGASRCPHCELPLTGPLATRLFAVLSEADRLLHQLRTAPPVPATPPTGPGQRGPAAPGPVKRARHGLSAASVPGILLGLGAVCLLVAALVFLAVTWSVMGVAGRTATLVGFTVVAGVLASWLAARRLRAAAECLSLVSLGLLAFDLVGARDSDWFGDIGLPAFLVLLGGVLLGVGAAASVVVRRTGVSALAGAEVVAALGLGTAVVGGMEADWLPGSPSVTLAVVLAAAAALAADLLRLKVLRVGAGAVASITWLMLLGTSWERAVAHASGRELWLELEVWPLLAAAVLAGTPALVVRLPGLVRVGAVAVAETVLLGAFLAPFVDESLSTVTTAGAGVVLVTAVVALAIPTPWVRGTCVPLAAFAAWMGGAAVMLAAQGLDRLLDAGLAGDGPWAGSVGTVLEPWRTDPVVQPWLLPVTVAATVLALVVLARTLPAFDRVVGRLMDPTAAAVVVAAATVGTAALYPVPLWLALALALLAAAGFTGWGLASGSSATLAMAGGFLTLGLLVGLHTEGLTLPTVLVGLAVAGALRLRATAAAAVVTGGVLLPAFTAAAAWTVGALADADGTWTAAVAILVVAALTLAPPGASGRDRAEAHGTAADVPGPGHRPTSVATAPAPVSLARAGTELGALAAAFVLALAGLEAATVAGTATWAAVYLTLIGGCVSATALLRADRRAAGWLGGALLAAASWVRLWDVGVEVPEAYTLPSAVALAAVGLVALRRNPDTPTMTALSAALGLGLVPSLIWVLWDPVTLRSVLLGVACLALIVGGVRLRWTAPVVFGASVGLLVVLRHSTPLAEAVPRWALIATAGALLIGVGITWERRLNQTRALLGYVRALR